MFLHGFQQGTLHFGWCTVDFVRQHEIGKHRTSLHLEVLVFLRVNHGTHYVSRQQVWRKLNATIIGIYQLSKGFDGKGFRQSRNTFQQDMSIAQQSNEQGVN